MIRLDDRELVGRARERDRLAAALDEAAAGRGGARVVLGEAGLGKSRLRREAEALARDRGILVLSGRCVEGGAGQPFRPFGEALTNGFRASGPPPDSAVLSHLATLALLVPSWSSRPAIGAPVLAVAEAVLTVLAVAGRGRGVLLSIEDLHWADTDTVAVVEYLVDNAAAHGAGLLVTLRPDPSGPALDVVRRLADRRAASILQLGPLAPAAMDDLVRASLEADAVPADLLEFVRRRADGVPFLAEELLLGLEGAGALRQGPDGPRLMLSRTVTTVPQTLAESIERRLATLGDESRDVVAAAALLGRRFDWHLVAEVTRHDEAAVLASLREATDAHLLEGEGDGIRFRHALTRDHVVARMLPPERAALARRTLAVLEADRAALDGDTSELAAELAELAGHREAASRYLLAAARHARDRGALATAASTARRALGAAPAEADGEAHALLAELHARSGDVDTALAHAAEAGDGATQLDFALAQALLEAGRPTDARPHVERSAERAVDDDDRHARARADLLRVQLVLAESGELARARELAEAILDRPELTPSLRCEALELLGRARRPHDVAAAEAAFATALTTAEAHDLALWRARALHELGTIDLLDRMRLDRLVAARRAAIEAGAPATAAVADLHLAAALVARGDTAAGRAAAERAES
ncbi:AAA family ATPase [Egicoccus sp. AB-alg2]|uniref:ATP-binding protein n=1 Tax=Egicoccus sp. AB-alg2 TaxID=3242693 RepID=UPI00359E34ED